MPNCDIRPHYGYDGEAPRFCAQHRAEGMHNLRSRRCQVCSFLYSSSLRYNSIFNASRHEALHVCGGKRATSFVMCLPACSRITAKFIQETKNYIAGR